MRKSEDGTNGTRPRELLLRHAFFEGSSGPVPSVPLWLMLLFGFTAPREIRLLHAFPPGHLVILGDMAQILFPRILA